MTTVFDRDRIRADMVKKGLADHADGLLNLVEPSVRLETRVVAEDEIPVGSSKLGGSPDLPAGFRWPAFGDQPLSFVAQVNLAEVHRLPGAEVLPGSGLLSFFYDSEQSIWGFDPQDRAGWTVKYWPVIEELRRTRLPDGLPEHGRYSACRLVPRSQVTFAPWESADIEALALTHDEMFAYSEAVPEPKEDGAIHRLLGHPDPIQGDMQLEAQLASHGLYCGDDTGYDDPRAEQLRRTATEWRLLLQIDSEDAAGMMWGDLGRLYYWIRRADLARRRFDDVWLMLQCG
jgi:uncharacterized protein YwqG